MKQQQFAATELPPYGSVLTAIDLAQEAAIYGWPLYEPTILTKIRIGREEQIDTVLAKLDGSAARSDEVLIQLGTLQLGFALQVTAHEAFQRHEKRTDTRLAVRVYELLHVPSYWDMSLSSAISKAISDESSERRSRLIADVIAANR